MQPRATGKVDKPSEHGRTRKAGLVARLPRCGVQLWPQEELTSWIEGQTGQLKDRTIQLLPGTTKNDRGRTIRMTEEVFRLLGPCVEQKRPEDAVFTWENGDVVKDFRSCWDTMCKAAKVEVDVHDFRRTAVRNLVWSEVSEKVAMRISGHVTRSVFDRYDIGSEDDLVEAAQKLEDRRAAFVAGLGSENSHIGRKLVTRKGKKLNKSVTR